MFIIIKYCNARLLILGTTAVYVRRAPYNVIVNNIINDYLKIIVIIGSGQVLRPNTNAVFSRDRDL